MEKRREDDRDAAQVLLRDDVPVDPVSAGQRGYARQSVLYSARPHGTVVTDRRVQVDMERWDDCLAFEEFGYCRKLVQAKLSLESALLG